MCTSVPEADSAARQYFADYEVYDAGQRTAWGQVTLACSADTAMQALRSRAALQRGVEASAIRLRNISRL